MSCGRILMIIMGLLLASALPLQAGPVKGKPVKLLQQWMGSVDDLSLMKGMPKVITSAEELERLWQAWRVPDPLPKVDFSKNLVVVATTRGSMLRLTPTLDDKGNLQVMGIATKDLRPGFRYVIAILSREGVKTVDGKELAGKAEKLSPQVSSDEPAGALNRVVFLCEDGKSFTVDFVENGNSILLQMDGNSIKLPQVPSGSGARYSDGKTTVWTKGEEGFVEVDDKILLRNCKIKK
jgi:membrane-bound inhibitor of C-type lysozyme